jgi:hypothetical protein
MIFLNERARSVPISLIKKRDVQVGTQPIYKDGLITILRSGSQDPSLLLLSMPMLHS